jgi:hypothetical protein
VIGQAIVRVDASPSKVDHKIDHRDKVTLFVEYAQ